jgi:hypothetical protein
MGKRKFNTGVGNVEGYLIEEKIRQEGSDLHRRLQHLLHEVFLVTFLHLLREVFVATFMRLLHEISIANFLQPMATKKISRSPRK